MRRTTSGPSVRAVAAPETVPAAVRWAPFRWTAQPDMSMAPPPIQEVVDPAVGNLEAAGVEGRRDGGEGGI